MNIDSIGAVLKRVYIPLFPWMFAALINLFSHSGEAFMIVVGFDPLNDC